MRLVMIDNAGSSFSLEFGSVGKAIVDLFIHGFLCECFLFVKF